MTSVVFEKCRTHVAERDATSPMRTSLFLAILVASACAMFGSVTMPANAQTTVDPAGGGGDVYLLWLWVSILITALAVGVVCVGIAFAFGKRTV